MNWILLAVAYVVGLAISTGLFGAYRTTNGVPGDKIFKVTPAWSAYVFWPLWWLFFLGLAVALAFEKRL